MYMSRDQSDKTRHRVRRAVRVTASRPLPEGEPVPHLRWGTTVGAALAVALTALTASCSVLPATASAQPTRALGGTGPITFATGKVDTGYLGPLVAQWNRQHPRQHVTPIYLPDDADDQHAQLVANLQAKSPVYDVMSLDVIWTAEFADNGWITPLPRGKFPMASFLPPAVATATYGGRLYAVPFTSNAGLLYYRKDILAAAGRKPPVTWAQLAGDARTLAPRYHMAGYGGQFQNYEGLTVNFAEAVQSAGGSLLSKSGQVTVDSRQAKAALSFLVSGFRQGWIPRASLGWDEEASRRAFEAGKLLFLRNWPYVYLDASMRGPGNKVAGKFGVTTLPGLHGPGSSTLGGENLAISAYSQHQLTALRFIQFLTSKASERQILLSSALPPVWTQLYASRALIRRFPFLPVLRQAILSAKPRPDLVNYTQFSLAISSTVHQALALQIPANTALAQLASQLGHIVRTG
jgi:multiple sugar transport system substrate-binding protein